MGGYATWDAIARHPERFAAAAPMSGAAAPELAPRLLKTPIWAFHGDADATVPINKEQPLIEALKKLNAPVQYTVYPGVEHDSWTQTYDNPALYEWLLKQSL
jgi:predicted peptidase